MQSFFVKKEQFNIEKNEIEILGDNFNHIKNVLRCNVGDKLNIVVENENKYLCIIKEISKENIVCNVESKIDEKCEANIKIDIFQGLPKSDKMEYIIQKCTELGVWTFVPVRFKRCIVKFNGKDEAKKIARWNKIAEAAAMQSGRTHIPFIKDSINLEQLCNIIPKYDIVIVAYEDEKNVYIKNLIKNKNIKNIALIIGPEGGLDKDEIYKLKEKGANIISLGNRILRTETAPIVMTSIIMYELGDIGG